MIDLLEMKEWHETQRRPDAAASARSSPVSRPSKAASLPNVDETSDEAQLKPFGSEYLPTPDMIRRRCLEIQAEWSNDERRRRAVGMPHSRPEPVRVHRLWVPTPECA